MLIFTRSLRRAGKGNAFAGLVNVAQASFANTGSHTPSGTRTRFKSCRIWTLGNAPCSSLKFFFMPWGLGSVTGHEEVVEMSSPVTIDHMTATFNGVSVDVKFGGSLSHTFVANGLGEFSDALTPSQFGMTTFPPGAQIVVKHKYDLVAGQQAPSRARGFLNWQRLAYDPVNEPTNGLTTEFSGTSSFTSPTGAQALPVFGPNMIVGVPTRAARSWMFIGDSITADGVGDGPNSLTQQVGGYLARAGYAIGDAFFVHGLGGRGAYHWVQSGALSQQLLPAFNASVIALGTNDISNGHDKAKTLSDWATIASQAKSAGHAYVLGATLPPRVSDGTSANNNTLYRATDLTNQFPYYTQNPGGIGYEVGGYKDQFNSDILANKGTAGYPDDVIDMASVVTDPTTSSKWKLPTTQFSTTLAANVSALSMTASITAAPTVGDCLVFNVGSANVDPVQGDVGVYVPQIVTGAGPYTVTFAQNDTFAGAGSFQGKLIANALTSGAVIKNTNSNDETHPSAPAHAAIASTVAQPKLQAFAIITSYDSATNTLLSSFATDPGTTRKNLIDSTIKAFKDWGVWGNFVALHFQAAHEHAAYLRNWVNPGTYDIVEQVAPTFTIDRGITGNGSTQWCTMGLDPSLGGTIIAQNDIHAGMFVMTSGGATGSEIGSANSLISMRGRAGVNAVVLMSGGAGVPPLVGLGNPYHLMGVRSNASQVQVYTGGALDNTGTVTSTGVPNSLQLLKVGSSTFSGRQIACTHIGNSQMSNAQLQAVATIIRKYMVGVGAAT